MSTLDVLPTADRAARAAAEFVAGRLREAIAKRGKAFFAVSGGSSPKPMLESLAVADLDWNKVRLFWVDERMVPPGHPDSNFSMTDAALIQPAGMPDKRVHRIHGELAPANAAARYCRELREAFRLENGEFPRFDLVHLGLGADSHTASLFPGELLIHDRTGLAASVYAPATKSYRVTLLPGVLLNAASTVFLAAGADKAPALQAVREGLEDFLAHPAQLVERCADPVTWFVDEAAASGLAR